MNDHDQFKNNAECLIIERINENNAIEGYDMSIKLNKPIVEERCLQVLASRKFTDLLNQREKRNRLSEDIFLKLIIIHNETKNRSEDPNQYLQSKKITTIIRDYIQQNFVDEIRKEKSENYWKLLLSANPGEDSKRFEEFYEGEKFLKVNLQYFQAHFLKIDQNNCVLIDENKRLKEQLNNISTENEQIKSKLDKILGNNEELKVELAAVKSKSDKILGNNEELKVELAAAVKSKSDNILCNNEKLKVELATIKSQSDNILCNNEKLKVELATIKSHSVQLLKDTEELKSKVEELKSHTSKIDLLIQSNG